MKTHNRTDVDLYTTPEAVLDMEDMFENQMEVLNEKHKALFQGRKSMFGHEQDFIQAHFSLSISTICCLKWNPESYLPETVRKECESIFILVFGKN